MAGETDLAGRVIRKGDFHYFLCHGEQRHMARIASENSNMNDVLVFD
jgi:hypothetical protein